MRRMWQFVSSLWRRKQKLQLQPGHHTLRIKRVVYTPKGLVTEFEVVDSRPLRDSDFPPPLKRITK